MNSVNRKIELQAHSLLMSRIKTDPFLKIRNFLHVDMFGDISQQIYDESDEALNEISQR